MITQPLFLGTFSLYAIILSSAAALGLLLSWLLVEDKRPFLLDAGSGIIVVSLISARVGFVLRNLSYFLEYPGQIPQFWLGGLSWPGALIGAVLGLVGIHLIWKESLGELADLYLPLLGVMSVGIWLLTWWSGIGFGPEVGAWLASADHGGFLQRSMGCRGDLFSNQAPPQLWISDADRCGWLIGS